MNLGFKVDFVPLILSGEKIHTIREDIHNRWGVGTKIHFCTGIRTKKYNQFRIGECVSTQKIEFVWNQEGVKVFIDGEDVTTKKDIFDKLAKNDGFADRNAFFEWEAWNRKYFKGKILHWTKLKY